MGTTAFSHCKIGVLKFPLPNPALTHPPAANAEVHLVYKNVRLQLLRSGQSPIMARLNEADNRPPFSNRVESPHLSTLMGARIPAQHS